MLWFRAGVVVAALFTLVVALTVLVSIFIMCVNPANGRAMNTDPYYNGTLAFYIIIMFSEIFMVVSSCFGLILAFRIWRNNHQLDHRLRRLFSFWLATLCTSSLMNFIMGIVGVVRYREPQEEMMTLFEIFSKYNQDVKFVGSFERYQRENSCCGINGPDDWMMAQFKQGGGGAGGGMYGGGGMAGGYDSYMGSPSTGKCHLTPPTIPMGCGKRLLEDIHWTMNVYSGILILETLTGIATATLGWYCFFYWIEKEVIIIPEDEVSNLIVIEPESSQSTVYTTVTDASAMSDWSRSRYSLDGHNYSTFSRPYSSSRSRYTQIYNNSRMSGGRSGSRYPSTNPYNPEPYTYRDEGYSSGFGTYQPNTPRATTPSRYTKISNFNGAIPSIGGPHSAYLSMQMVDPNDEEEKINQNLPSEQDQLDKIPRSISEAVRATPPPSNPPTQSRGGWNDMQSLRLHQGSRGRSVAHPDHNRHHQHHEGHHDHHRTHTGDSFYMPVEQSIMHMGGGTHPPSYYSGGGGSIGGTLPRHSTRFSGGEGSLLDSESVRTQKQKKTKQVKKEHSINHMLHKQEKALGGKVLAEMRIDHSRDPQPMNSYTSTSHVRKGHRAHHATIALIKNKKPPKPQEIFHGPEQGHGQTGHLATDILAMSGGAGAAKSLIDNVNLKVEHDPNLAEGEAGGYLKKLRKQKKGQDHPDKDNPGHGPVKIDENGMIAAPSADGSQAQLLIDNLFNAAKEPPPKEPSVLIKPHDAVEKPEVETKKKSHHSKHHHHHHHEEGHHHHHHEGHHHHNHHDKNGHGHHHHHNGHHEHAHHHQHHGHHHEHDYQSLRGTRNEFSHHPETHHGTHHHGGTHYEPDNFSFRPNGGGIHHGTHHEHETRHGTHYGTHHGGTHHSHNSRHPGGTTHHGGGGGGHHSRYPASVAGYSQYPGGYGQHPHPPTEVLYKSDRPME